MEIAVLWIYQKVKAHGIEIEAGQKPALCLRGRKHMLCVVAGHPVRVLKRTVKDFDKARRVVLNESEYPVNRAIQQLSGIGSRNGLTEKARKLLQKAQESTEVDEEEFTDEEGVESTAPPPSEPSEMEVNDPSKRKLKEKTNGETRPNLLAAICTELKIEPSLARRKLRKVGLSAPYDNEASIRSALGST